MTKWADYLISAIRYENETNKNSIAYFKIHKDIGDEVGSGSTWSRAEVIDAIYNGKTFCTIIKGNLGEWKKGVVVTLITKNGNSIITDNKYTDFDNLSDLQEL